MPQDGGTGGTCDDAAGGGNGAAGGAPAALPSGTRSGPSSPERGGDLLDDAVKGTDKPAHRDPFRETTNRSSGMLSGLDLQLMPGEPVYASHSAPPGGSWAGHFPRDQAPRSFSAIAAPPAPWIGRSLSALSSRPEVSVPVTLHVYDLGASNSSRALNTVLGIFGAGIFHCGLEVYGREWSFRKCIGGTGVFSCRPRCCQGQSFAESILMGQTVLPKCDVLRLITSLSKKWLGADYNILTRNCCHFCKEFCRLLNAGEVPDRIMAAAATGEYLEVTGMSYRAIMIRRFREKMCCASFFPDNEVEDVPEAMPVLALPSNTTSPSQAIPTRLQESLLEEYRRMSVLNPVAVTQQP